ncbi:MAG: hypothetical protein IJR85_10260 [Synergistaceae bacterium]|nr:hypothetical protein [Synergistaceae bacterium]
MSERTTGDTAGGAATCAIVGAFVAGPVGALVGGAIGGLFGFKNVADITGTVVSYAAGQAEKKYRNASHDTRFSREQRQEFSAKADEMHEGFDRVKQAAKETFRNS